MQLTTQQLASVQTAFGWSQDRIFSPQVAEGGFSGAGIWKLNYGGNVFGLRRWPRNALERPRIIGLHRLLQWWHSQGFLELPVPIPALNGGTLLHMDHSDWQLEPWMPGNADFHADPNENRVSEILTWLAKLHHVSPEFRPDPNSREWFRSEALAPSPNVSQRCKLIRLWNPGRVKLALAQVVFLPMKSLREPLRQILLTVPSLLGWIEMELKLAATTQVPLFPCLRDLWHDHLLFTGDRLTGVIDPSACKMESASSDLSRLLGSLFPFDKSKWDLALDVYASVRTLSSDERKLIVLLDHSQIVLSGLHWVERILWQELPEQLHLERLAERLEVMNKRIGMLSRELGSTGL